ncbi:hypothetical protein DRJ16_00505 [Candidatus Woesearchaeota archaeon]|nr:MAG: hypothetical protein DRJ16_00505 [Candidatus Woesearchaeota archaeon]
MYPLSSPLEPEEYERYHGLIEIYIKRANPLDPDTHIPVEIQPKIRYGSEPSFWSKLFDREAMKGVSLRDVVNCYIAEALTIATLKIMEREKALEEVLRIHQEEDSDINREVFSRLLSGLYRTFYSLKFNFTEDHFTGPIAYACQEIKGIRSYVNMARRGGKCGGLLLIEQSIRNSIKDKRLTPKEKYELSNWISWDTHLTYEVIREAFALELLRFYLGVNPGQVARDILRPVSIDENTKLVVEAFWRYFMYSGFAQVDKNGCIIRESVPDKKLLTELVDRFIEMYRLKEDYQDKNFESHTGKSVDEFFDPERIAENFLELKIKEESKTEERITK